MNLQLVEQIANAVLYEGYLLYPYRASSVKNRHRFNWGALAPRDYSISQNGSEAWEMQTECLITGNDSTKLNARIRFLHLTNREVGKVAKPQFELPDAFEFVQSLEVDGQLFQAWQEAVERDVDLPENSLSGLKTSSFDFAFPASRDVEPIRDAQGKAAGVIVRTQQAISGRIILHLAECEKRMDENTSGLFKLTVQVQNSTPFEKARQASRDDALLSSLVSTHTILSLSGGEFVSLIDPPEKYKEAATACRNIGTYPVLVGNEREGDCILSSPIILYDYPEIAPESAGNLFDSAEIDEILTLRIMTMSDDEKREMRSIDEHARAILERTERLPEEQLLKMHGARRGLNT